MLGTANPKAPAANAFPARWTPYLGQVLAPFVLPAASRTPSQELSYPMIVAFRSLDVVAGAVVGGVLSLAAKAIFPGLRWTKQQGMIRIIAGSAVGVVGSFIPVGGFLGIVPLAGGIVLGTGIADQILPKKKSRTA